jgi:hypothetical protein
MLTSDRQFGTCECRPAQSAEQRFDVSSRALTARPSSHHFRGSAVRRGEIGHSARRPLLGLLYQPRVMDGDCGAFSGMIIANANASSRKEPAPVPLGSPRMSHGQTLTRTRTATVIGQCLCSVGAVVIAKCCLLPAACSL